MVYSPRMMGPTTSCLHPVMRIFWAWPTSPAAPPLGCGHCCCWPQDCCCWPQSLPLPLPLPKPLLLPLPMPLPLFVWALGGAFSCCWKDGSAWIAARACWQARSCASFSLCPTSPAQANDAQSPGRPGMESVACQPPTVCTDWKTVSSFDRGRLRTRPRATFSAILLWPVAGRALMPLAGMCGEPVKISGMPPKPASPTLRFLPWPGTGSGRLAIWSAWFCNAMRAAFCSASFLFEAVAPAYWRFSMQASVTVDWNWAPKHCVL
mmetsp:Transcript_99270/g.320035  ORF Transcript_99270/g.320035 Transcript_99270/m.320035 type:complete len:264 (+) Transcript_99270:2792-3583(+)